jgi:hypothetical protein
LSWVLKRNQWYKDGALITSSSTGRLEVKESGNYSVRTTIDDCSSVLSDPVTVIATGLEGRPSNQLVTFYPNPATTMITLQGLATGQDKEILIIGSTGIEFIRQQYDASENEINIRELPAGLYILQITTLSNVFTTKFIKK